MAQYALDTEKGISIKLGTQVKIEIEGVGIRLRGTLVGMEPGEYLIVKLQDATFDGLKDGLFQGNKIIVRYVYEGSVFGFLSKLIETILTPIKLLYIEYPRIIENFDLRSQKRMDCFLPSSIIIRDEERQGSILDISEGGCCFLINMLKGEKLLSVQIDEQITLRCQFPGIEGEQMVSGKARKFSMDKKETALRIQFYDLDPEVKNTIAHYISTAEEFF